MNKTPKLNQQQIYSIVILFFVLIAVTDLHPAISTYSSELCQQFLQKCEQFEKYCSRLEIVRTDKLNMLTLNGARDLSNGLASIGYNETEDVQNADVESLLSVLSVTTKTAITNTLV